MLIQFKLKSPGPSELKGYLEIVLENVKLTRDLIKNNFKKIYPDLKKYGSQTFFNQARADRRQCPRAICGIA
jgi:hypothetical protein